MVMDERDERGTHWDIAFVGSCPLFYIVNFQCRRGEDFTWLSTKNTIIQINI